MSRVIITGGNGFIGSHITAYFQERGVNILHPSSRELDILDEAALNRAFRGADTVIHNAARAVDWGERAQFFRTNVLGTRNVLRACLRRGVRQVIMTGSCSVFGEEDHPAPKDEHSPRDSHYRYFADALFPCAMNHYRDSKRDAAVKAAAFAERHGMNLTILHPVWVYGERELHTGFLEYLQTVRDGLPAIMGSGRNLYHAVYAGDLAKAYYLAWQAAPEGVHEYIIGDPEPVRMDDFYRLFCEAAGLRKPPNLPKALLYPAALAMELAATLRKKEEPPLLTRGRLNMFYDSIAYSTEKARRELGFTCSYSMQEAMKRTVRWYRENGYL